jgi:hypothetical protein
VCVVCCTVNAKSQGRTIKTNKYGKNTKKEQVTEFSWGRGREVSGCSPGGGKRFFSSPKHPEWLWGLASFLLSGCQAAFPGQGMMLTIHLYLELRLRLNRAVLILFLYAFVARTGTVLPFYRHCSILLICFLLVPLNVSVPSCVVVIHV